MSHLWTARGADRSHRRPAARTDAGGHRRHLDRHPDAEAGRRLLRDHAAKRSTAMISPARRWRPAPACWSLPKHKLPALGRVNTAKIVVPDVLQALEQTGIAARARSQAKIIAVTGSAGKTSTKEALRHGLSTRRQGACVGQVVQQSLGRAADAGAHARRRRLRDLRDRHEPCGRNPPAGQNGAAACRASSR